MRLSKIAATSAALVLSAGLLAACSDDSNDGATKTSSSSASQAGDLTKDTFATTIASAMQKSGSAHITLDGTVGGQQLKATGDQNIGSSPEDSQVSLEMKVAGQTFDLRLLDQTVYFNLGALSENKYAVIDLTDDSNPLVAQFKGIATQADVSAQFASFEGAISAFEKGGKTEKIDGVDTQPYTVTVDTAKLAKAQGQELPAGTPATLDYTFYVGSDDLPRRLVSGTGANQITLGFTKWGEDVTVEKPAKAEITDLDLSKLGQGAS